MAVGSLRCDLNLCETAVDGQLDSLDVARVVVDGCRRTGDQADRLAEQVTPSRPLIYEHLL